MGGGGWRRPVENTPMREEDEKFEIDIWNCWRKIISVLRPVDCRLYKCCRRTKIAVFTFATGTRQYERTEKYGKETKKKTETILTRRTIVSGVGTWQRNNEKTKKSYDNYKILHIIHG